MAAYASLVSLMNLIDQIQRHPDPPLSLDPKQAQSLTEKIGFLQGFLEDFHSRGLSLEIQDLESQMTDVAHAAEDVIESQILLASGLRTRRRMPAHRIRKLSTDICEGLRRVIKDMEFIEKEAAIYTKKKRSTFEDDDRSMPPPPPPRSSSNTTTMVGFDDICIKIMERLTGIQSRTRDIIPLVGMGGVGKTTLARNIYEKPLIVEHFHTRSWVTISQEWVLRDVLIEILLCQKNPMSRQVLSQKTEGDLGELLHKSLFGGRYLIVMDDMWSSEAWDKLKFFLPDNNNGSRIMITSRSSNLASDLTGSSVVKVDLLDDDKSWDLLCKKVFGEKNCPLELEETGRTIARNCKGLPLSIVTIGGLLAKFDMTREYWEYVAENLSSLVKSQDDEQCLRILSLSYIHLPVHLKPSFLYMGLFPEDGRIRASDIINLWVSEGFLKPISGKSLEMVGEDYLKDLFERNLVLVNKWGFNRKIRSFTVHDLVRDLCLREARKENFFSVVRIDNLQVNGTIETERRIAIHRSASNEEDTEDSSHHGVPYSAPFMRSCIIHPKDSLELISLRSVRLLRILASFEYGRAYDVHDIVPLANLRCIFSKSLFSAGNKSISFLWSMSWLQTLMVNRIQDNLTQLDIWKMPHLRHIKINDGINLSNPPSSGGQLLVLEDLQTLSKISNFKWSEEVVKRIPKVKELSIEYTNRVMKKTSSKDYCLDNLGRLQNLESLFIRCGRRAWCGVNDFTLPSSLKKLTLQSLSWDDTVSAMIGGSLPFLEVLKLYLCNIIGEEWNSVEGQFCRLKYLQMDYCKNLKYLNNTDSTHFPCLERLRISGSSLEEFPSSIGDITTLRLIDLFHESDSVIISAKRMLEEQEEQFGNETLLIHVTVEEDRKEFMESLRASNNFKVGYVYWTTRYWIEDI